MISQAKHEGKRAREVLRGDTNVAECIGTKTPVIK
jgi:hypothetical protein